ncbi:MAG: porin [Xanthobacteraceae bacterium]|nr:porin [Xanthobacteraceae bacterium]
MNIAKSLILGSAATLVALGGAQAADLPLKAKAVEYVKVCSLYGAGFYYIPGTDTCIKLGGYLRADTSFNAAGAYNLPKVTGNGANLRTANNYIARARQDINIDTRTATEYGVVRTYFDITFNWTTGSAVRAGVDDASGPLGGNNSGVGVYYAFIQFAGFTIGKAISQFSTPWTGYPGNNTSYLIGGPDDVTGINQLAYTAQFGNGVSAAISLEDSSGIYFASGGTNTYNSYNRAPLYGLDINGNYFNGWGGANIPDIVGQIRVDQAWGLFQVSAVAHNLRASYYNGVAGMGSPGDAWGFAVTAGLSLRNLPTGAGDSINFDVTYADGASRYVVGGVSPDTWSIAGNQGTSLGSVWSSDGIFGPAGTGGIHKTQAWGLRGAFNHNWDPHWSSSLFGSYTQVRYSDAARALVAAAGALGGNGASTVCPRTITNCNPGGNIWQIGTVLRWTPVKNLTFSGEVLYSYVETLQVGTYSNGVVAKDNGTWTFGVRAQRVF